MELGAPTEADVIRLFSLTPADLDLKKVTLVAEEGQKLTVFPVDLHGVPEGELASIRRLRYGAKVMIAHEEQFLDSDWQVDKEQGKTWKDYLVAKLVSEHKEDFPSRRAHKLGMKSWSDLVAKADGIHKERGGLQDLEEEFDEEDDQSRAEGGDDETAADGGQGPGSDEDAETVEGFAAVFALAIFAAVLELRCLV